MNTAGRMTGKFKFHCSITVHKSMHCGLLIVPPVCSDQGYSEVIQVDRLHLFN